MLLEITTTGKVTLIIVAGVFIAWALVTAIFVPRRNPDFPRNVSTFVVVTAALFVVQMGAVYWVTSTQDVEKAAAGETTPAETTPAETTPAETTPAQTTPAQTTPAQTTPAETTPVETAPAAGGAGDAAAGKQVFASAGCGGCHTLAGAGSNGTVGPNLDQAKPAYDLVVTRVTNGRGAMPPFKGQLDEQQIKDVAAYVSSVAGS